MASFSWPTQGGRGGRHPQQDLAYGFSLPEEIIAGGYRFGDFLVALLDNCPGKMWSFVRLTIRVLLLKRNRLGQTMKKQEKTNENETCSGCSLFSLIALVLICFFPGFPWFVLCDKKQYTVRGIPRRHWMPYKVFA